jgi:hypothetical protein
LNFPVGKKPAPGRIEIAQRGPTGPAGMVEGSGPGWCASPTKLGERSDLGTFSSGAKKLEILADNLPLAGGTGRQRAREVQ